MGKVKKLIKNEYVFSIFSRFVSVAISLIQSILVARFLGSALQGTSSYITSITNIGAIVITFGMHQAYPYFRKKYGKEKIFNDYMTLIIVLFTFFLLIAGVIFFLPFDNLELKVAIFLIPIFGYSKIVAYVSLIEFPNKRNLWWTIAGITEVLFVFVLWASAGFNGEWLLGQLKKEANLKQQLFLAERAIDIEKMIKSIDGDLMLTIPAIDSDAMFEVPYLLVGQTKNQDFLNDVDYWTTSMREYGLSMTSTGDNQYRLNADDMTFYWGTRPKELYFTSSPDLVKTALSGQGSDVLKALDDEIRDSRLFVYLNIQQMANSTNSYSSTGLTLSMLSQHFEGVSIRLTDAQNMELNILMKNKDENMLGALIGGLLDSLGALTRNFAR